MKRVIPAIDGNQIGDGMRGGEYDIFVPFIIKISGNLPIPLPSLRRYLENFTMR